MRAAALSQFLIDITRGHRSGGFAAEPAAVLAGSPLDDAARAAVRDQDIGSLWLAGAHPMALLYFARACGWDNARYYRCLDEAELRRSAPGPAPPSAASAPSRTHPPSAPHGR